MKRLLQLLVLVGVLAGAVVLGRHRFPGPETRIRRQMVELQELVTFSGKEGNLAQVAASRQLSQLFTEEARIRVNLEGGPNGQLQGRESIFQASLAARQMAGGLKVEFLDVTVRLEAEGRAAVVEATGKAVPQGSRELWVQELRFRLVKTDQGWFIESVETVRTLTENPLPRRQACS